MVNWRVEDKMVIYQTNIENFNKKIVYYLEEIKTGEKMRHSRYDFVNFIKKGGIIHCSKFEEKNFKDLIFINLVGCSKEIENKLKELI